MAKINITQASNAYVSKDAIIDMLLVAETYLRDQGIGSLIIEEAFDDLNKALRLSREVTDSRGKLIRTEEITEDVELEVDIEDIASDVLSEMAEDDPKEVLSFINDDVIIDDLKSRNLWPEMRASAYNDYHFRRLLCDMFETGYHVEDWQLIKSVAVRLDKSWEVL